MRVGSQDFEKLPPMVKALIREAWRTWRWAGENAWMLSSMMAMAQLSEDVGLYSSDSGIDFNKSPSWSQEPDDLCEIRKIGCDVLIEGYCRVGAKHATFLFVYDAYKQQPPVSSIIDRGCSESIHLEGDGGDDYEF